MFAAEATGPIKTKLHPRLSTSAKWIWSIYLMLTIACIASYYVAGMNLFDSFNYAMTTTATGGFSTHNSSTSFFHSPALEYICAFFCFLSGVNFTLLYAAVIKFKIKDLFKNSEFKFYMLLVTAFTAFIMVELIAMWNMPSAAPSSRWYHSSPPRDYLTTMLLCGLTLPGWYWQPACSSEPARAVRVEV